MRITGVKITDKRSKVYVPSTSMFYAYTWELVIGDYLACPGGLWRLEAKRLVPLDRAQMLYAWRLRISRGDKTHTILTTPQSEWHVKGIR
jgi:hypothetical protein